MGHATIDENGRHTVVVAVAGIVQSTAGIDILLLHMTVITSATTAEVTIKV